MFSKILFKTWKVDSKGLDTESVKLLIKFIDIKNVAIYGVSLQVMKNQYGYAYDI